MPDPKITDDFTPPTEHKAEQTVFYAFYRGSKASAWFLGPSGPTKDDVVRQLSSFSPFAEARIFSMRLPAPWSTDA